MIGKKLYFLRIVFEATKNASLRFSRNCSSSTTLIFTGWPKSKFLNSNRQLFHWNCISEPILVKPKCGWVEKKNVWKNYRILSQFWVLPTWVIKCKVTIISNGKFWHGSPCNIKHVWSCFRSRLDQPMKMEEAFFSASNCLECHACAFVQPPFEKLTSLQFFILYIFPIFRQTNDFFFESCGFTFCHRWCIELIDIFCWIYRFGFITTKWWVTNRKY